MFTDARTLADQTRIDTGLAIIGGGPAGITLARAFAGSGIEVCIVEAGGREFDPEVQSCYDGEIAGIDYPLQASRLRYFGGSSNHWGGYCLPLDAIDFERRDWVPNSGWPFGIEELEPYYGPASAIVEVGEARFDDVDYWQRRSGEPALSLATGRMRTRFVQYSPPTRFGERYRADLEQAGNIRVLLNANVVEISATENASAVTGLAVRTLNGRSIRVHAQQYVLATGGLENARMLLLSNRVVPMGLGNQHDRVGRYFMEHPHLSGFGTIMMRDLQRLPTLYRERMRLDGRPANASFKPSDQFLREERQLNAMIMVGLGERFHADTVVKDGATAQSLDMLAAAHRFLSTESAATSDQNAGEIGVRLGMGCACEQVPNPDSRVTLSSSEQDVLGLPKIRLDWRLGEQDRRSVVEHMRSLALEFGALGLGRMRLEVEDDGQWPELVSGGNHHMGTTRMHDDPKQGVVDRNGKVHGMVNLHVAGSSVFPTSGASNPTLTIVALTLRLADHLRSHWS